MSEKELEGLRVRSRELGSFFLVFPDDEELVKEETEGQYYINVDIYKIGVDEDLTKLDSKEVTPEIEQFVSQQINELLMSAIQTKYGDREQEGI